MTGCSGLLRRPARNTLAGFGLRNWPPIFTHCVDVADFSGVEGVQRLSYLLLVDRILVGEQMYCGRLLRIEAQQPADALGDLALVTEGTPADAHPQVRDVDSLPESWATQARY
jgi:hypothetical protein